MANSDGIGIHGRGPDRGGRGVQSALRTVRRTRYDVIVIGGGQAGLSVGYHLKKLGLEFVILDASARIGDAWRQRWDTLRLFTPARYDGLDGMPFPGPPSRSRRRTRWPTISSGTPPTFSFR